MVDTIKIKIIIDPYIRTWLSTQFIGHSFEEKSILLPGGGSYAFDAVSEDGLIVGEILSNRHLTSGGNENTGGVRKAHNSISYLNMLPQVTIKIMIFSDLKFYELIKRRSSRWGAQDINMKICKLPPELESIRQEILNEASDEQSRL